MKRGIFVIIFAISAASALSQSTLHQYVEEGLRNNLALQQKEIDLQVATRALQEARGMFLPEVTVSTRYSRAEGGRMIEFPTGDLLNPVYSSLNQLMELSGDDQFPMLENQKIPFLREREHDTRISVTQPVFNASLISNKRLKEEQLNLTRSHIQQYKKELTFKIKEAYFDYLKSREVLQLFRETRKLAEENVRVNQKLLENDMATRDAIFRARAELEQIKTEQNEAAKNVRMAGKYFNFLLNRPLDAAIDIDMPSSQRSDSKKDALMAEASKKREELKQIEFSKNIYGHQADLSRARNLPSVFLSADYGFQGEQYHFSGKDDFAIISVGLKWTLFKGSVNRQKREQALLRKDKMKYKKQEIQRRIELQLQEVLLDLEQKEKNLKVSQKQAQEANENYRIIQKKHKNGMASQVELLDAQNSRTRAAMNIIINEYQLHTCHARLEKIVGRK